MKLSVLAISTLLLATGCSQKYSNVQTHQTSVAVENIGATSKRELSKRTLHTHSLMQVLMRQSREERSLTTFAPDSDDIFVSNAYLPSWLDSLMDAQNKKGVFISGDIFGKSSHRHLKVKDYRASSYTAVKNNRINPKVLRGDMFSGKYIIKLDEYAQSVVSRMRFNTSDISIEGIMNKMYGVANAEGRTLYFDLDDKSKVLRASSSPYFTEELSPYKRQFFVNYLNSRGIRYTSTGNRIAIADNFTSWVNGMNKLVKLNKYKNAVYAVHDGKYFFEVSDGTFQKAPVNIELINWVPGKTREYNVYSHGFNRKINTDKQFYDFFLPNGKKKYTVRFY